MTKKKHNRTVSKLRAGKRNEERELDKLCKEVTFMFWGGECLVGSLTMRTPCVGVLDPHHVAHRGKKSVKYLIENVVPMCRKHHSELNNAGTEKMFKAWFEMKYPERWSAIHAAARTLSTLKGKEYINFWREYLLKEKEKLNAE